MSGKEDENEGIPIISFKIGKKERKEGRKEYNRRINVASKACIGKKINYR
jgi:hypothetical protein